MSAITLLHKTKWLVSLVAIAMLCIFLYKSSAHAQTTEPEFMVTWRAESFVPADFKGKALPAKKTRVEVVFNLIENQKIVDLKNTEVRWYRGDKLEQHGSGVQSFMFVVPDLASGEVEIRIQIPDYKGASIEKAITVPVVSPQLIIKSPYLNNEIKRGEIALMALPYFFNITNLNDLIFHWLVNGSEPTQGEEIVLSPNELTAIIPQELPPGRTVEVRVSAQSTRRDTEVAGRSLLFTIGQ